MEAKRELIKARLLAIEQVLIERNKLDVEISELTHDLMLEVNIINEEEENILGNDSELTEISERINKLAL